jgi:Acyclic terpene utilisation family protein AtuA
MKVVRIGNGCGFWGDNVDAPILLAEHGRLDYLTLEYLAELTMSILARQVQRDPQAGFATDFLDVLKRLCPILAAQPNLKVITNAGGMNPAACATKVRAILDRADLAKRRIATVTGDDLRPRLDQLLQEGHHLAHLDSGAALASVRERVVSANAYLGAQPICEALSEGASIVITGRVADASLTLGPAVYELGWGWDDWDRLAAGTVAGHLIECGAQVTGGLWCNWQEASALANVGYPVAEIQADGTFRITKPPGTGGAVNVETVTEQLLYEVGDPAAYLTPDVIADFTSVQVREVGPDVIEVMGARGKPAPENYKVSIAYQDGYMASGTLVLYGHLDADEKAQRCGEILLERLQRAGASPHRSLIECLGRGDCAVRMPDWLGCDEAVLRVAAWDGRREVIERFTKEFAPLVTSGPPGVTGYTTGRPAVREVFAYWPALIAKTAIKPMVLGEPGA